MTTRPNALVALLADTNAPIDEAALLVAKDLDPTADLAVARATMDALAERARGTTLREALANFRGDDENYYAPENSLLPRVLAKRRGLPLTVAVVWMGVGRRAGVSVEGIGFPGHFLVRVEGELVDPFGGGRTVSRPELEELATRTLGHPELMDDEMLQAVDTRSITLRMLNNLRGAYARQNDHARALIACDRLVDLTGAAVAHRDRGLHALALGAHAVATEDLGVYLREKPYAKDVPAIRRALELCEGRAVLN